MLVPGMQAPLHVASSLGTTWVSEHFSDVFCWYLGQPHSGKPCSQLTVLLSPGRRMISCSWLAPESGCTQNIQLDIDVLWVTPRGAGCHSSSGAWRGSWHLSLSSGCSWTLNVVCGSALEVPQQKPLGENGKHCNMIKLSHKTQMHKYVLLTK